MLRDRIAAAIYGAASQWDDHPWDALAEHVKEVYLGQADAVIESLNLTTPVDYPSVDGTRHHYMVAGHYMKESDDE